MKNISLIAIIFLMNGYLICQTTNWSEIKTGTNKKLNTIDFPTKLVGYIGGNDSLLLKTTDGGKTWNKINFTGVTFYVVGDKIFSNIVQLKFMDDSNGYMATGYNGLYKTTDGGNTWSIISSVGCITNGLYALDQNYFFAGGSGCFEGELIFKLVNGVWNRSVSPQLNTRGKIINFNFLNANFGLAASTSGLIFRTFDGGNTWDTITTSISVKKPQFSFYDPMTSVLVVNDKLAYASYKTVKPNVVGGMLISTDNGLTWQEDKNTAISKGKDFLCLHKNTSGVIFSGGVDAADTLKGVILESSKDLKTWFSTTVSEPINSFISLNDSVVFAIGNNGYLISKTFRIPLTSQEFSANELAFSLSPNPVSDVLNIEAPLSNYNLSIVDLNGKIILNIDFVSSLEKINVFKLLPQMYIFILLDKKTGSVSRKKFLKI